MQMKQTQIVLFINYILYPCKLYSCLLQTLSAYDEAQLYTTRLESTPFTILINLSTISMTTANTKMPYTNYYCPIIAEVIHIQFNSIRCYYYESQVLELFAKSFSFFVPMILICPPLPLLRSVLLGPPRLLVPA